MEVVLFIVCIILVVYILYAKKNKTVAMVGLAIVLVMLLNKMVIEGAKNRCPGVSRWSNKLRRCVTD